MNQGERTGLGDLALQGSLDWEEEHERYGVACTYAVKEKEISCLFTDMNDTARDFFFSIRLLFSPPRGISYSEFSVILRNSFDKLHISPPMYGTGSYASSRPLD